MARFYQPDWSATPEPVPYANFGNPQSLNLYTYVRNNPLSFGDPDGHLMTPGGVGDPEWEGQVQNQEDAKQQQQLLSGVMAMAANAGLVSLAPGSDSASDAGVRASPAQNQVVQNSSGPFIAKDPEKYMGTCVGSGQCVDFVKADTDVPRQTKDWAPGAAVDKNTPPGAAIATFGPNGTYQNIPGQSHAAELVSVGPDEKSAVIRDQFKTKSGQVVVHTRTILNREGHGLPVNDLSRYRVIMKREDQ